MILVPEFKNHLRVQLGPPDLVFFLSESGCRVLHGRLVFLLAPLVNGINTIPEIVARLRGQITALEVESGIFLLASEDLLVDARDAKPSALDAFRDSLNIDPKFFERRLRTRHVHVRSFCDFSKESFVSILTHLGIRVSNSAGLVVALTDDYLRKELRDFNQQALRRKQPWMIVKPTGCILWIGPVFNPPRTACWNCMAQRLGKNREADAFLQAFGGTKVTSPSKSTPAFPSITDVALNLAAIEILKWLVLGSRGQSLELTTLDARQLKLEKHFVPRLDDCNACGISVKKKSTAPGPIILKSRKKLFTHDGGHRSASAETTFQKYKHHVSPITGIVDQVELFHSDANGLVHSFAAGHLFVPPTGKEELLARGLKQISMGKGMTSTQARTGALCEALERYSGVFRGNEFRITERYQVLGDLAIHPNRFMNYSEKQYRSRGANPDRIPMRFNERRMIDWTPAWSLTNNKFKYAPTAYCYYGCPRPADHDFCRADSNGSAAGNTLEEAILHGFLELVERDCAALWWFNRAPRPAVELESFALPFFGALRDYYRTLRLKVHVLDITSDFQIPTFAALAESTQSPEPRLILGLGAHFDPVVALSRALTEMNQFLPVMLSGGSKRILQPRSRNLEYLRPDPAASPRTFEDFPHYACTDLKHDVIACVKLAELRGMETLILDQTRPDVGLPVVKVMVPGMRQLWPRFRSGRLYDIPVQLGWLKKALQEDQLNPDRIVI